MTQAVIFIVLASIIFNWLYRKEDNVRKIGYYLLQFAIFVTSIVALALGGNSPIFIVYFALLIASSLAKLVVNEDVLFKILTPREEGDEFYKKTTKKTKLILFYVDALLTIIVSCFVWSKITYIIIAIAFLMLLILVHEFGHYIAGKILKFKINEFSVGFGPAILQKTKANGEKISLRVFPLGGYCAFEGEDEESEKEGAFNDQKPWKRLIVLFAGVFFNFLFGIITSVVYLSVASYSLPQIIQLSDGNTNPFKAGDIVVAVDGDKLDYYRVSQDTFTQFAKLTSKHEAGEEFVVTVLRDGSEIDLTVKKEIRPAQRYITNLSGLEGKLYEKIGENSYSLISNENLFDYIKNMENPLDNLYKKMEIDGVDDYSLFTKEEILSLGGITESTAGASLGILQTAHYEKFTFGEALLYAVPFGIDICWLVLKVLGGLFTGATAVSELGGTITSVDAIAELTRIDFRYLIYLLPMISMNLAVFNILPIPALDGAKMVFVTIEMIRRKPINRNVEAYIHFIGLILLLAFVVFLDIYHFI